MNQLDRWTRWADEQDKQMIQLSRWTSWADELDKQINSWADEKVGQMKTVEQMNW